MDSLQTTINLFGIAEVSKEFIIMNRRSKTRDVMVKDFNGFRCKVRAVMTVVLYLKVEYVSVNNKRTK